MVGRILNTKHASELWYRKPMNNCFSTSVSQKIEKVNSFQANVPSRGHKKKQERRVSLKLGTPKFAFININMITSKNNQLHPN